MRRAVVEPTRPENRGVLYGLAERVAGVTHVTRSSRSVTVSADDQCWALTSQHAYR